MDSLYGPGAPVDSSVPHLVAAADNGHASRVPNNASYVVVADETNDANDWIILPTGVKPGHVVWGWSVPAHEIRTEPSSGIKINGVDSDGSAEAAMAATSLWCARFIDEGTGWILFGWSEAGAALSTITPD